MIATARNALHTLLQNDATFVAAIKALHLHSTDPAAEPVPKVVKGNRTFQQIGQEHYPCWVSDAGDMQPGAASIDGDAMGLTIGSQQQEWIDDIELALVWHQQDFGKSVDQIDALKPALVALLLRNPSLADTCDLAYVAAAETDRNGNHPLHAITFTVRVHGTVGRG